MTLVQARNYAVIKKAVGWIIFLLAFISTTVSLLGFFREYTSTIASVNPVLADIIRVIVDMLKFNTPFLQPFWQASPLPTFPNWGGLGFWLIYIVVFFGLALNAAGSRQWRQYINVREQLEDKKIIAQAQSVPHAAESEAASRVNLPNHSPFRQYYLLYVLPIICVAVGYLPLHWLGLV